MRRGLSIILLAVCAAASACTAAPSGPSVSAPSPGTAAALPVDADVADRNAQPRAEASVSPADASLEDVSLDAVAPIAARATVVERFAVDPAAAALALALYDTDGDVVDVLPPQRIDGGYRGVIPLVPALPTGADRKHLAWVAAAVRDFDDLFAAVEARAAVRYRWRGLTFRFFRSVGNTTPNAFAQNDAAEWTVAYNVNGSIDTTADRTRETLFHEIFHLDDADHGDWSPQHLTATQDAIRHKCGASTACLTPYAPTATIVRRGTYYAFQPGNDVHEYAAEVALRWYEEQRAVLRHERRAGVPFKCGPPENRRAWEAIATEFFGGVDLVPGC